MCPRFCNDLVFVLIHSQSTLSALFFPTFTVSGTIPNNFGNFQNLEGLFLEHNRLVGTIPKSIFRGSGLGAHPLPLRQLFLEQNSLSGSLNEGLARLPDLQELYVDGNKLTGVVPEPLCNAELNDIFLNDTQAAQRCDGC